MLRIIWTEQAGNEEIIEKMERNNKIRYKIKNSRNFSDIQRGKMYDKFD